MSYVTGRDMVELALEFGESLAVKMRIKYQLLSKWCMLLTEIINCNKFNSFGI